MKKLAFFFLLTLCLTACSADEENTAGEDLQRAENVTIFESKDSQHKWLLRADEVDFDDLNSAILHNPHLLLRENGQDSAQISGKRGTFDYTKKLVTIEGDALVKSFTEQVTLATERFFYDVENDRIWSDQKTTVTRASAKITARGGIETDSKLTKIEFKKQSTQLPADLKEFQGARP
ncbi:MAG: LPS export ABC transporter periplasmic protein LptC [Elusimicrobiaceae bacterium]|nr:LPS export ABC transporter periplasmic protein LptC [Elusimicrobiaceae bacterium]